MANGNKAKNKDKACLSIPTKIYTLVIGKMVRNMGTVHMSLMQLA